MKNLLLTLGHNSSAVLIENGRLVWGLETERVSRQKSDSRFPTDVLKYVGKLKPDMVYVSHWAPDGILNSMSEKHWLPKMFDGIPIRTLNPDLTHHDAHIHGAICYAGPKFPKNGTIGMVVDGFGTMGEHFSIYDLSGDKPKLLRRVHGYDTSLGLWYQYATAFMGMKMHEDEYKLLGYETHVSYNVAELVTVQALDYAREWIDRMTVSPYKSRYDPLYALNALPDVKTKIWDHLSEFCKAWGITDSTTTEARQIIAFYVQAVLENVVCTLAKGAKNLLLSGGCFYNVKLNKLLVDQTPGVTCIYPLAGDQGNGVGLYAADHPEFVFPDDLNWGPRLLRTQGQVPGLQVVSEESAAKLIQDRLDYCGYVNLVRGACEFGPRAMCNTSTLAHPLSSVVEKINTANERNTVMPMAPVMTREQYSNLFKRTQHVWRSEENMVVALEYAKTPDHYTEGIAHRYGYPTLHYTGRPQVALPTDTFLNNLLEDNGPLINTSFNFHGEPIALGMDSIIDNHLMQYKRDDNFHTVVIKNG